MIDRIKEHQDILQMELEIYPCDYNSSEAVTPLAAAGD